MPYGDLKPPAKKWYKKTKKMYKKPNDTKSLVKLIKNVSLQQQETKMTTHDTGVFVVKHNISSLVRGNLLTTTQGIGDSLGTASRIGDTITPVGLKMYMTFRQPTDRPNVSFKVWILKIFGVATPPTSVPVKAITGNLLMDPIDTEKATTVKILTFKYPDNYWQGTAGTSKDMTFFRKLWIPLPKTPYTYGADNSASGKKFQLAMYITAYDSFGTLITDTIGEFACAQCFYFKDA